MEGDDELGAHLGRRVVAEVRRHLDARVLVRLRRVLVVRRPVAHLRLIAPSIDDKTQVFATNEVSECAQAGGAQQRPGGGARERQQALVAAVLYARPARLVVIRPQSAIDALL